MKIRFLWDFFGPSAEKTAGHFEQHLKEFLSKHELSLPTDCTRVDDNHWCASCDPPDVPSAFLEGPEQASAAHGTSSTTPNVADQIGRALRPQRLEEI